MRFFPLGHRVYIRPVLPSNTTEAGLELVKAYEPVVMGEVVAVGLDATSVCVGETVVFPDTVGQEIRVDGESPMLLMDERDIAAVVTADPVACPYCCRPLEEAMHG